MDHGALKTFATSARKKLMQQVAARLDYVLNTDSAELRERERQIKELKKEIAASSREEVIERVAYTWFNRFAALRFMDANGYNKVKVLSPQPGFTQPEILAEARKGNIDEDLPLDRKFINRLLDGQVRAANPENEAFKLLLVALCNSYNAIMPFMFEKIQDYTDLLLPDDLISDHSIVADFRENLTDEDCGKEEVLGWFYQYYVSDRKDEVMARKTAVPKQDIPAVTQLFTPHWIVRYLVENSLGRLWLLNRPHSKLREKMPYYIEGEAETDFLTISRPEDIRLLDPAGGSGHMLTYAFDLLYAIYEEEGYDAPDIPGLILRHNLYGVDICDRAVALAAFALCMKARAKDHRFFRRAVQPHLISLQEIRFEEGELREYIRALNLGDLFNQPLLKLLQQFEEAKNFGSLIQPCLHEQNITFAQCAIEAKDLGGRLFLRETHLKVLRVLEQAGTLTQRYHVVVANPPYMGSSAMNASLKAFVRRDFEAGRQDAMTCFMQRGATLLRHRGFLAMINLPSWLFISSFDNLRKELVSNQTIINLLHLGRGIFGSDFGTVAFVLKNSPGEGRVGIYRRLFERHVEVDSIEEKERKFLNPSQGLFKANQTDLLLIEGTPIAYSMNASTRTIFQTQPPLGSMSEPRQGLSTTDNNRYLRYWFELSQSNIGFGHKTLAEATGSGKAWFPLNKGGGFRKWHGNDEYVVRWMSHGNPDYVARGSVAYFREGATWGKVTSGQFSVRRTDCGYIFSDAGMKVFHESGEVLDQITALLNAKVTPMFLASLSETINFEQGVISRIPYKSVPGAAQGARSCISIARADWDNFETSWDFRDQPLLRPGLKSATLPGSWQNWKAHCDAAIRRMQELETENNRLFITAYGLEDELKPEVPEDQITLARPDARKDMIAFVSYAVGCMLGRYSLDQPGLILANGGETLAHYLNRVPQPTFKPDEDGVLPILEAEYFEDDIVGRFREFLRVTFGEENYQKNLEFVEESLGKDIRKYFLMDFYKNHLSNERAYGYKKRPIYWMFSSPKKTFNALIYMHRYHPDMVSIILNNYLREFMIKLRAHKENLVQVTLSESARNTDKAKAQREISKIEKGLADLEEYERNILFPLAAQRIAIDLDDGVKVNYQKFGAALHPVPGLAADKEN